jgi:hypothetical protein
MILTTIEQRTYDAFEADDAEEAKKYLDTVMASWKEVSTAIGRVTLFTLILAVAFEFLMIPTSVTIISIGPLAVRNSSLVQEFIPILVAYLLYYELSLSNSWVDHQYVYEAILYRFQPKLARSHLTMTVQPKVPGPWTFFGPREVVTNRSFLTESEKFDLFTTIFTSTFIFLILPLAFEVQAYYELVRKYGADDILVIVSAILSGLLIVLWITCLAIGVVEEFAPIKRQIVEMYEKLYSGDLAAVAEVISELENREHKRGLSGWEKEMLDIAGKLRQKLSDK